jgi:hypothetical protein
MARDRQNPKPESRNPKAGRNPKAESNSVAAGGRRDFGSRVGRIFAMGLRQICATRGSVLNSDFGFRSSFALRLSIFGLGLAICLAPTLVYAQAQTELKPPPPLPPEEGRKVAKQLIANLLTQKPTANATNTGFLIIRDKKRQLRQVPVQIEVVATATNFLSVYRTADGGPEGMELTVVHPDDRPNAYEVRQPPDAAQGKRLAGAQLLTPFAGSDFWATDLGLEFLHWPQQRVMKKEMRHSVFCDVLESIDPQPLPGGYARVVSWIGANHPDETVVVHADAYDARGKLLKEFDPKKLEKVNGAWQLQEMEMRNIQTGSKTAFQFKLTEE